MLASFSVATMSGRYFKGPPVFLALLLCSVICCAPAQATIQRDSLEQGRLLLATKPPPDRVSTTKTCISPKLFASPPPGGRRKLSRATSPSPPPAPLIKPNFTCPPSPTSLGWVEVKDAALHGLIANGTVPQVLAAGFVLAEGPAWSNRFKGLFFTENTSVWKWTDRQCVSLVVPNAGYHGNNITEYANPRVNGLALDKAGNLIMCQHGDRSVSRLASWSKPAGALIPLATKYQGKRLSSPNDLAFHYPSGNLFFTDPPYGLYLQDEDPLKEVKINGVYRLDCDGKLTVVDSTLSRPNGVALGVAGKKLYVGISDAANPVVMEYDVNPSTLQTGPGRVFFNFTNYAKRTGGLPDGLKVDEQGNVWTCGPGGLFVISPKGVILGRIWTSPQRASNMAFGGPDGKDLYITLRQTVIHLRTKVRGAWWKYQKDL